MHVRPVLNTLHAALAAQAGLASGDPAVEAAMSHLAEALGPALQVAALELAQQAAAEVGAQLPDHTIDVVLVDGETSLRVTEAKTATEDRPASEDFDARITLRLPPSLKELIEDAAGNKGDSVNGWVVDALSARAAKSKRRGSNFTQSFDL